MDLFTLGVTSLAPLRTASFTNASVWASAARRSKNTGAARTHAALIASIAFLSTWIW